MVEGRIGLEPGKRLLGLALVVFEHEHAGAAGSIDRVPQLVVKLLSYFGLLELVLVGLELLCPDMEVVGIIEPVSETRVHALVAGFLFG